MKRVAVLLLGVLIIGLAPGLVSAQGLLGAGLPGLPSMGGFFGSYKGCGDGAPLFPAPTLYVGYGASDRPTEFGGGASALGVAGVGNLGQRYRDEGIWLGVTAPLTFNDYVSFLASGWYLIPTDGNDSSETYYNTSGARLGSRNWSTKRTWWYVDGLFALGSKCGLSLLAGVRYDYYTVQFNDPNVLDFPLGAATDEADVVSQGWIPLVGTQYALNNATTNLVFRVVGIPTLVGYLKYNETINGANRLEASGNYKSGYFVEAFAEYGRKLNGAAYLGIFGRYQATHGQVDASVDLLPGNTSDTYKIGVNRNAWAFGGSFTLSFNMPMM